MSGKSRVAAEWDVSRTAQTGGKNRKDSKQGHMLQDLLLVAQFLD